MAYDAATGNIVLFGGYTRRPLDDTWTWDGSTWTKQAPAPSPSARYATSMAYDAATGNIVLFGGGRQAALSVTPGPGMARPGPSRRPRPSPPARTFASMAYDAATGNIVLFGGLHDVAGHLRQLADTWTWG